MITKKIIIALSLSLLLATHVDAFKIKGSSTGTNIRGANSNDVNFDIVSTEYDEFIDAVYGEPFTENDLVLKNQTSSGYIHHVNVSAVNLLKNSSNISWLSLTPSVATVDSSGNITRVSNGTATILATANWVKKSIQIPISSETTLETDTKIISFASGSLGKNISDNIDSRISDVTSENASSKMNIFSTKDDTNGLNYVRNTSGWMQGIDLTSFSPWNSLSHNNRAGTLISPRHILYAYHYRFGNFPVEIHFVTNDNQVISRNIIGETRIGSTDIEIGILDEDVPSSITPAKILPANWHNYIPGVSLIAPPYAGGCGVYGDGHNYIKGRIPIISCNQYKQAMIGEMYYVPETTFFRCYDSPLPDNIHRYSLYKRVISGDSGSPAFIAITEYGNELPTTVLLNTWYAGGAGAGPDIVVNKSGINLAMSSLSASNLYEGGGTDSYQLTEVNLSGFPTY